MSRNWSLTDEVECVISWKTKVSFHFLSLIESKIIYKRYASLYFIASVSAEENELLILEIIHRYVEVLDQYFGNVSFIFMGGL